MTKKEQHIDKFIELRIKGHTFDEIAKSLKVSKQSLINWHKDKKVKEAILTGRLTKYQSILKAYEVNREAKITRFAMMAHKINQELDKRDLSEIGTDKLLKLATINEKRLDRILPTHYYGVFGFGVEDDWFEDMDKFYFNPSD